MSQFLIVMLVQLLLVLICVVGGIAFYNYRRRHEEEVGTQMLVYHINSRKDLRIDSLTSLIEKVYGSQGEELKNIVDQLYLKEADCYRELIQVFMNRDPKQLPKMYDAVQRITAAYEGMLLQLNPDNKDQVRFTKEEEHAPRDSANNNNTPASASEPASSAPSPAPVPVPSPSSSNTEKSVDAMTSTTIENKDSAKDSSVTYQQDVKGLSTGEMDVKVADNALETQQETNVAAVDKNAAANTNSNAEVIKDKKEEPVVSNPETLPSEQEMAYYQDKLMTYLESKEVSKSAVTEVLDKDNQKEVAK